MNVFFIEGIIEFDTLEFISSFSPVLKEFISLLSVSDFATIVLEFLLSELFVAGISSAALVDFGE